MKELSITKMSELARSFDEWEIMYTCASGELKGLALTKMSELLEVDKNL